MSSTPLRLLHISNDFVVISKPAGIPFHQSDSEEGVMQLLRKKLIEEGKDKFAKDLHPVHRLDTVTSGILLFARGKKNARELSWLFEDHDIEKLYVALSTRRPKRKQGLIRGDMERSRRGSWKLTRTSENPAVTRFITKAIPDERPGLRLFLLKPETGRTHQLRVAMKSLGSPILGDHLYGPQEEAKAEDRTYLHACALRFDWKGESFTFIDPPDEGIEFASSSFQAVWESLGEPFGNFGK